MKNVLKKYHSLLLILILAFTFFTRVWRLDQPPTYVFDEVYHAVTAKLIARNDPRAYEWWNPAPEPNTAVDWLHPPLAKYTQAFFIRYFGENSFGWRFSSALFGVLVIAAVYQLTLLLFKDQPQVKNLALLTSFLSSLDGLLLVQSRVAMNDIHVTFFILLTLIFYLLYRQAQTQDQPSWLHKYRYLILTGLSAGLAMGTKWSGVFILVLVGIYESFSWLKTLLQQLPQPKWSALGKKVGLLALTLGILPILVYVLSYSHMFLQGKSLFCFQQQSITNQCYFERIEFKGWKWEGYISHFAMLHRQIWNYQTHLEATHTYQSRPYQWFLDLRPVWFHVEYIGDNQIANIYTFGNPALFWIGDVAFLGSILSLGLGLLNLVIKKSKWRKKLKDWLLKPAQLQALLFLNSAYLITWLPWQLSPRIMFFYHYTPAVPLLSINLGFWLMQLLTTKKLDSPTKKIIFATILGIITLVFVVWYPDWTNLPMPKAFVDHVYFFLSSWK